MRKFYLDNLRIFMIMLLFPVHTFMVYNDFGTKFYVWPGGNRLLSTLIVIVNPWFMPILFVIAGMCARYALEKRTQREFIAERVKKLLIPFIAGLIFLVPIQTFYARKFFFSYEGSFLENLLYFFTHLTDFSGYDGGFSPGHLWFILFLFLVSTFSLVITRKITYKKVSRHIEKLPNIVICGMFLLVWGMYFIGNFGGFSLGKNLVLYLLGYYVLSNDEIMKKLEKSKIIIYIVFFIAEAVLVASYFEFSYYGDLLVNFVGWMGILSLLLMGKKYLNFQNKVTKYLNSASYPIYIFHQSILVALAYFIVQAVNIIFLQVILIMCGSILLTFLCYEIVKRIPGVRTLAGIK